MRKKFIYFESSPTLSDRMVCLPKKNSTSENVCYNPNEDITYRFDGANDINVDDTAPGKFCLTYTNAAPTIPEDCVRFVTLYDSIICIIKNTAVENG
jgi:hypothetical protein